MLILFVYLAIIIRHCCYTTGQNSWVRPYNEINTLTFMYINCTVHALTLRCVFKKKLAPKCETPIIFLFHFSSAIVSCHLLCLDWMRTGWITILTVASRKSFTFFVFGTKIPLLCDSPCFNYGMLCAIIINLSKFNTNHKHCTNWTLLLPPFRTHSHTSSLCNTLTVYVNVFVCISVRINNWLCLIEMRSPF